MHLYSVQPRLVIFGILTTANLFCFVPVCLSIDVTGALVLCSTKAHWQFASFTIAVQLRSSFPQKSFPLCSAVRPSHLPLPFSPLELVCLSIDVTGALVLPFPSFSCFFFCPPLSLCPSRTGVSVHRRDRCACTPLPFLLFSFHSSLSLYWRVCP